jgi:hypothetical protein
MREVRSEKMMKEDDTQLTTFPKGSLITNINQQTGSQVTLTLFHFPPSSHHIFSQFFFPHFLSKIVVVERRL